MSKIVVLKLTSGEEIIAKECDQGGYESPRCIQMMQTKTGVQAGLVPWILAAPDATVGIAPHTVITETVPTADVEQAYMQQTSCLDLTTKM